MMDVTLSLILLCVFVPAIAGQHFIIWQQVKMLKRKARLMDSAMQTIQLQMATIRYQDETIQKQAGVIEQYKIFREDSRPQLN